MTGDQPKRRRRRQHEPQADAAAPKRNPKGQERTKKEVQAVAGVRGIGQRLLDLRNRRGMTQQQLQELSGVGRSYISLIETNQVIAPSSLHLVALAMALGVPAEYLLLGRTDRDTAAVYLPVEDAATVQRLYQRAGRRGLTLVERWLNATFGVFGELPAELPQGTPDAQPQDDEAGDGQHDGDDADMQGPDGTDRKP